MEYADESRAVREALGDQVVEWVEESIYPWSPVFRATLRTPDGHLDVVVKRSVKNPEVAAAIADWQHRLSDTGLAVVTPVHLDAPGGTLLSVNDTNWVAYPFVNGARWDGSVAQIAAAGAVLGRMHAGSHGVAVPGLTSFRWPAYDADSTAEDVASIREVCARELDPAIADEVAAGWVERLRDFTGTTLPAIRDAGLPTLPVSMDFKVLNLIFDRDGGEPTFIDFEKADDAPRLLDLAFAALLFSCESDPNPGRLLSPDEWAAFRDAYTAAAPPFTDLERDRWLTALEYIRLEEGMWHLAEGSEWDLPGQRPFLVDLLTADLAERFPLA